MTRVSYCACWRSFSICFTHRFLSFSILKDAEKLPTTPWTLSALSARLPSTLILLQTPAVSIVSLPILHRQIRTLRQLPSFLLGFIELPKKSGLVPYPPVKWTYGKSPILPWCLGWRMKKKHRGSKIMAYGKSPRIPWKRLQPTCYSYSMNYSLWKITHPIFSGIIQQVVAAVKAQPIPWRRCWTSPRTMGMIVLGWLMFFVVVFWV